MQKRQFLKSAATCVAMLSTPRAIACPVNPKERVSTLAPPMLDLGGGTSIWKLVEHEGVYRRLSQRTKQVLADNQDWLLPKLATLDGGLRYTEGGLLVQSSNGFTVFDTGFRGTPSNETEPPPFFAELARVGISVEEVSRVICSHFHLDHVGWNTTGDDLKPTFPNATYFLPKADWQAHKAGNVSWRFKTVAKRVAPLIDAGVVQWVEDAITLSPELSIVPFNGHSPGHMGLLVKGKNEAAILCGDVLHHPAQAAAPDEDVSSESPDLSIKTRTRFLQTYADQALYVIPTHCPRPGFGRIKTQGAAWRFEAGLATETPG